MNTNPQRHNVTPSKGHAGQKLRSDNGHVKQMGKEAMYASYKRWNQKVAATNYIEVNKRPNFV